MHDLLGLRKRAVEYAVNADELTPGKLAFCCLCTAPDRSSPSNRQYITAAPFLLFQVTMSNTMIKTLAVLVALTAVAAPCCQAARLLRAGRFANEDDPSGYSAYNAARIISPLSTKTKSAVTPEAAETNANSGYIGAYRASTAGGNGPLSYSTVEADPVSNNPNRRKEVIKPRARSAQDLYNLTPRPLNIGSGAAQIPALVMNGAAVSQTYEGATAAAMPEAIFVNQGGKRGNRKTVIAHGMLTASTGSAPKASRAGSFGVTGQPVGSLALSGAANGKIVLAQADTAVAMAQTEKVDQLAPISRTAWQN
ncbi:hypothetical protein COO60DRAFT_1568831 [Scenedesmus sp. NREL 46B-D3]|nr:hypothetical protein COO60DRAFT_1568831 [Scenedesmus sp. NREL 46B-D3]